jgi:hypothetical protein
MPSAAIKTVCGQALAAFEHDVDPLRFRATAT